MGHRCRLSAAFRASPEVSRQEPRFRARDRTSWVEATPSIAEHDGTGAVDNNEPTEPLVPPLHGLSKPDEATLPCTALNAGSPSLSNADDNGRGIDSSQARIDADGYARLVPSGDVLIVFNDAPPPEQPSLDAHLDHDGYLLLQPHGAGFGARDASGHVRSLSEGMEHLNLTAPIEVSADQIHVYDAEQDVIYTYMEPMGACLAPSQSAEHVSSSSPAPSVKRNNSRRHLQHTNRSPSPQRGAVTQIQQVCEIHIMTEFGVQIFAIGRVWLGAHRHWAVRNGVKRHGYRPPYAEPTPLVDHTEKKVRNQ